MSGVTTKGETICGFCEAGEYCAGGDAKPAPCEEGTWDDDADAASECVDWTDCEPGEYVDETADATHDRSCKPCKSGYSEGENADECQDWTDCAAGQYVLDAGTPKADRTCDNCASGFTSEENQGACADWIRCIGSTITEGSTKADTECAKPLTVTGGSAHTCALFEGGGVSCWGSNQYGQMGVSGTEDQVHPQPVPGLSGVSQIDAGQTGSCAVTSSTVKCWGTSSTLRTPQGINGIANAASVASGSAHSCAVLTDGTMKCWGDNSLGQLTGAEAQGSQPPRIVSFGVPGVVQGTILAGATTASASSGHTCALKSDQVVACWGGNSSLQLGASAPYGYVSSVLSSAIQVAAGYNGTCAVRTNGTVTCWGSYNAGDDTFVRSIPEISAGAVQVVGGENHWCVLFDDGSVKCWGEMSYGQLGNGKIGNASDSPVDVTDLEDVTTLGAGANHTCAIVESGDIYCWGRNDHGQLGDGTKLNRSQPVKVLAAE